MVTETPRPPCGCRLTSDTTPCATARTGVPSAGLRSIPLWLVEQLVQRNGRAPKPSVTEISPESGHTTIGVGGLTVMAFRRTTSRDSVDLTFMTWTGRSTLSVSNADRDSPNSVGELTVPKVHAKTRTTLTTEHTLRALIESLYRVAPKMLQSGCRSEHSRMFP
jgi:hypothetical protein